MAGQAHATATATAVAYRRNGKLFSCEPCRKGKLRCDHTSPTCGRCLRRGRADQCVYHPAPLTKSRPSVDESTRQPPIDTSLARIGPYPPFADSRESGLISPPVSLGTDHMQQAEGFQPMASPLQSNQSGLSSNTPSMLTSDDRPQTLSATPLTPSGGCMSYRDSRHHFFGPTHYSAVFTEASGGLSFDDEGGLEPEDLLGPVPADKIEMGAEVLSILRDMPSFLKFAVIWTDFYDGLVIPQPVFQIWCDDFWAEFGSVLEEGNRAKLLRLSELVWRNTRRSFRVRGDMTAVEWSKAATGRNIRWEVIGIILSLVALVSASLCEWDGSFDDMRTTIVDRSTFGTRMRKLSERCLCFCYECESINDMYLCFAYQDLVLVHLMKGEAHFIAWQRTGEMLDTLVALGLHQGNRVDSETPFFLAELRKKLFVSCYSRDKETAGFLGRPPRLSYRYCKLDMPLDLTDEQLFMEGADLENAVSQLDPQGWNTSGKLHRRTWTRTWFQECLVREEILELALGSGNLDINEQAATLKLKLKQMHSALPAFVQVSPEEVYNPDSPIWSFTRGVSTYAERMVRQLNELYIVCISTGMMLTEFLLERAVVNRSRGDTRALIPISRKILSTVLLAQSRRELFREFRGDIVYMLASYGLPSAGVLAVEMLKQEQNRNYAPDLLPKSEIVQSLSVFISALTSVGPGEGNYTICNQGRRALKKVLDQILAPSVVPAATLTNEAPAEDASLYFPTGNDAEFLAWLDNIAWDKAFVHVPPTATGPP